MTRKKIPAYVVTPTDRRTAQRGPGEVLSVEQFRMILISKENIKRYERQASSGRQLFMYTNHHPQPPAKCIGKSNNCQEVYLHLSEINYLYTAGTWDILGYV